MISRKYGHITQGKKVPCKHKRRVHKFYRNSNNPKERNFILRITIKVSLYLAVSTFSSTPYNLTSDWTNINENLICVTTFNTDQTIPNSMNVNVNKGYQ
jgi:hypothetical protein